MNAGLTAAVSGRSSLSTLLWRLAWRNIWRHRRRSWITILTMAIGLVFSLTITALFDGIYGQLFTQVVTEELGHAQVHHPDFPRQRAMWDTIEHADDVLVELETLPEVRRAAPRVHGHALVGFADEATGVRLVGIDPDREDALTGLAAQIDGGAWLAPEASGTILLGHALADRLRASLGDEIVALTQSADGSSGNDVYVVVGTVKTGSVAQDRRTAWMHIDDLQALLVLPDEVHEIALVAASKEQVAPMVDAARAPMEDRGLLLRSWAEIDPKLMAMLEVGDAVSSILLFIVFGVAGLGILNTMMMSVFERTRELGMCRALGLKPRQVVALVWIETLMLAAVALLTGIPVALAGDWYLVTQGIDLSMWLGEYSSAGQSLDRLAYGDFRIDRVVDAVIGLVVVASFAALWPAVRAARLKPVDAMRTL